MSLSRRRAPARGKANLVRAPRTTTTTTTAPGGYMPTPLTSPLKGARARMHRAAFKFGHNRIFCFLGTLRPISTQALDVTPSCTSSTRNQQGTVKVC